MPWSKLLLMAKGPNGDLEEHQAAVSLAADFFCRHAFEATALLTHVDVVIAIPASPGRYAQRHMSLPDELARNVQAKLGIPWIFDGLIWTGEDVELRGLSRSQRKRAIRDQMAADNVGLAQGREALVVDDVVTSGATLMEAARLLRVAGVARVWSMTLCHTEG